MYMDHACTSENVRQSEAKNHMLAFYKLRQQKTKLSKSSIQNKETSDYVMFFSTFKCIRIETLYMCGKQNPDKMMDG